MNVGLYKSLFWEYVVKDGKKTSVDFDMYKSPRCETKQELDASRMNLWKKEHLYHERNRVIENILLDAVGRHETKTACVLDEEKETALWSG